MKTLTTDVAIIGAGPVGLFQIFELGLQGLSTVVIDSLPEIGGQCSELYPDKPIYDIPALPNAKASEVIDNLWQQAAIFDPTFLLAERVEHIEKVSEHSFIVTTHKQTQIHCRAVVIAAGNGAFSPVKLKLPLIDKFEDTQLFYRISNIEHFRDKNVVVLGGGDSALDWSLTLQKTAKSVLLIHRSSHFKAVKSSVNKMYELCEQLKMQFLCGQVSSFQEKENKLIGLTITSKDGVNRRVELDELVVLFGMSPKLGPIDNWQLEMHQHQIKVDTQSFQTSVTGIYAVGDINYYPGKRKLILSGFHEAALAAFSIAETVLEKDRIPTLYTTTSPVVHQRLGVEHSLEEMLS
ncbi:NAD(P)/FAD-dependent oxidoreductase [Colwellia sp. Bg11-28]|uniref:NAD(P)/FAD-dependent oxidoreductase n=1 Tax=Colwellia sp. Bg11-28 TaxID=2058305 RepID=UPI000C328D60|nr:NAD(P)/FAD-dependent oxidoreductase [Colwellia sp. Bg11-28]PKH88084.1 ferredoxin--NADP(+) reductase [Colwellia sp. Bg11-28]